MDDILLQLNLPKFTFVKQLFFTAPNPRFQSASNLSIWLCSQLQELSVEPQIQ
ncbi:hypothetical protein LINPERPRIM_LOCUS40653, partial [Linum perenne]